MEWISVKERLPKKHDTVIIYGHAACGSCDSKPRVREGRYSCCYQDESDIGFEFGAYDCPCDVTHWMPLPEPPEENNVKTD